jgi:predicted nucleotidyltransferase
MTLNSYLKRIADLAVIRDDEKANIQRSISTLRDRLSDHFSGQLFDQFIFGSYSRETILPRYMDENSDVDYMVVFKDSSNDPQTYLNRLRLFTEKRYFSSEISLSRPTIILSLGHIKFDLVPAITSLLPGFRIPAKASAYQKWVATDPNDLKQTIADANKSSNFIIKPLIRILKYWNACNDYPFESFELEKKITQNKFLLGNLLGYQLQDYLFEFIEKIDPYSLNTNKGKEAVMRAKKIVAEVKEIEQSVKESPLFSALSVLRRDSASATSEEKIKKLLPIPVAYSL